MRRVTTPWTFTRRPASIRSGSPGSKVATAAMGVVGMANGSAGRGSRMRTCSKPGACKVIPLNCRRVFNSEVQAPCTLTSASMSWVGGGWLSGLGMITLNLPLGVIRLRFKWPHC